MNSTREMWESAGVTESTWRRNNDARAFIEEPEDWIDIQEDLIREASFGELTEELLQLNTNYE